jgi:heavy metal sensor kinase
MLRKLSELRVRWAGGLRFRLTLTYFVFITVLLSFLGLFFRETIRSLYDQQLHAVLSEEWVAIRGYLRLEKPKRRGQPTQINWYYDRDDPEEALIVDRLRQLYLLADAEGRHLEVGPKYSDLTETPQQIREAVRRRESGWQVRKDSTGRDFLIRSGVLLSEDEKPFYISIGRSYADGQRIIDEFTWYYSLMLLPTILSAGLLGWFVAGRALKPVNEVALTAQRITGANLTSQIPLRGSGDELDQLIEAFNRMIERLDESFRQTRQFSTDVSHELRTPLTAIRGQLEVALMAARTPEQYQDAIVNALQEVERLSRTIRALLLLSQAESGQLALQKQPLDFSRVTSEIVEQFGIPAESAQVRLKADIQAGISLEADRIQIERLISNLISNAVKYTNPGGEVTVTVEQQETSVVLTIADTGVGIAPQHLPYIFDRFYRVPEKSRIPAPDDAPRGLGLGLSFVAWIVKAHGGTTHVTSEPGKGTTFVVRLPGAAVGSPAAEDTPKPVGV